MSDTVMGVWSSLVKLAGTATNVANMPSPLLQGSTPFAAITQRTDGKNLILQPCVKNLCCLFLRYSDNQCYCIKATAD